MSTDSSSSSNARRGKMAVPYSSFSSNRVRTPSSARSGSAQCRRWASADLSHGPAYKSRPGLFLRQGPNQGAGLRQTCRAVGVSRDRQRLRRLLSCLPASKPDFRFVLSVPLSVESPFLSSLTFARFETRAPSRERLFSKHYSLFTKPSFARFIHSFDT